MTEYAGGEVLSGVIDEYPKAIQQKTFSFRPERAGKLLGEEIAEQKMEHIFSSLKIPVTKSAAAWQLTSPSWRVDLEQEVDAIEEIARIIGYESLPVSEIDRIPMMKIRDALPRRKFDLLIRSHLVTLGFSECLSTPMLSKDQAQIFHPNTVEVMNPLTIELERMRPSIIPNLLDIARRNERYGASGQRLFEIGNVFSYSDRPQLVGKIEERTEITLLIKDNVEEKNPYNVKEQIADIDFVKSIIEQLLARLGIKSKMTPSEQDEAKRYFDQNIVYKMGGEVVAKAGKISSWASEQYDLRGSAYCAEIDYEKIYNLTKENSLHPLPINPLPKFPAVQRDVAVVISKLLKAESLLREAATVIPKELLEDIRIFDEFESKEMKTASERSLGVRITLRAPDRTLEDAEADEIMKNIIETLQKKLSARMRS
jgi:phenylalanyl-tRNA synthetase beta chain